MADDRYPGERPFADVLGKAIADRSLALDRIAARLRRAGVPVSVATLSYWQTGRSKPKRARSLRAVEELERILDVPAGHLISALPGERTGINPINLMPGSESTKQLLFERGVSLNKNWSRLSIHDSMRIRPDRHEASTLTRLVMRAETDNVHTWPLVFYQDGPSAEPPAIEALSSCRIDEILQVSDQSVSLVQMRLPRPLMRGEMAMVEYVITWAETHEISHRIERSLPAPVRSLVLDVQFDCPTPVHITSYLRSSMDDETLGNESKMRVLGQGAQHIAIDAPPGIHGIAWQW